MQFHHYKTTRPSGYIGSADKYIDDLLVGHLNLSSVTGREELPYASPLIEKAWRLIGRPYYNVYPIVESLCRKTTLDVAWDRVCFPLSPLLFRFPVGYEPHGISSAIVFTVPPPDVPGFDYGEIPAFDRCWSTAAVEGNFRSVLPKAKVSTYVLRKEAREACGYIMARNLVCVIQFAKDKDVYGFVWSVRAESWSETVEKTMQDPKQSGSEHCNGIDVDGASAFMSRLSVLSALVGQGTDLITPEILSRDEARYSAASDDEKRWIEARACRLNGAGFSFGKKLQRQSELSPHWRNPHMALFWTGHKRSVPILKLRSGCVVTSTHLSDIPTGFLGDESVEDGTESTVTLAKRVAVPKRLRFIILQRDKYRCQLCGSMASDGARLEVDHKVPVAKGGKTTPENLWTLCHPCNNGKSDSDLHVA
jgi:hypothetical protein